MTLSHEAQQTLLLLSRRKQQDPNLDCWGYSDRETGDWTCLACNTKFDKKELVVYSDDEGKLFLPTHEHGRQCLKNHNLTAFL